MKTLLMFEMILLYTTPSNAQNTDNAIEKAIRELEKKEHTAMLSKDTNTLQQLWTSDFMVNAPNNMVIMGRQDVIDLVKKGAISYSYFTRKIEQVMVKGDMVITMGSEQVVPDGNSPYSGKTINRRYTNIWTRQNNTWKLTARHANEIPR